RGRRPPASVGAMRSRSPRSVRGWWSSRFGRGRERGLACGLGLGLVLALTSAPGCGPKPVAGATAEPAVEPTIDPARGSNYVEASSEPGPATTLAAPAVGDAPRIHAIDVDGTHDDRIDGERLRAEYSPRDPWLGAELPTVTLVAFLDYQCPYSKRLLPTLYELVELYPDDLRVVMKHHPLPMHPDARFAATAAIAAQRQGRFWVMHDALFDDQKQLDRASVIGLA